MNAIGAIAGRQFYQGLLEALSQGMGMAKGYLLDHGPRTAVLSHSLGRNLGMDEEVLSRLFFSAVLADIGMIGLVEDEWENPVPVLPATARAEVRRHPLRSAVVVSAIPFLGAAAGPIRHHHEWWDGSGYPDGLVGEEIPIEARVLRLADTVTALSGARPQRPRRSPAQVRDAVARGIGTEFDPELAQLWMDLERTGSLWRFRPELHRDLQGRALDALVPGAVPHSSVGLLLDLVASLIDAKDLYTGGHSRRVARFAGAVADAMGLDAAVQDHARAGGYLHDLGKLAVPSRVLRKRSGLNPMERAQVRRHAADGASLLEDIAVLRPFAPGCRHHHERWDGAGYPEGLSGDRIPRVAQIIGVSDAFDAMTSVRAYRPARSISQAMNEIHRSSGAQFDPRVTDAFLSLPSELLEIVQSETHRTRDWVSRIPSLSRRREWPVPSVT